MDIFELLYKSKNTPPTFDEGGNFQVDETIGNALLLAYSIKYTSKKYIVTVSNIYNAQNLYSLLKSFLSNKNICLFLNDELIRTEAIAESKELLASRLFTLNEILNNKTRIVITNVSGAIRFLPKKDLFLNSIINLKVGYKYNLEEIKKTLITSGYTAVKKIDQSFQYASRGDILDIYSINNELPIRIEFFDNEIESIRTFDIASQKSLEKINEVKILPASDVIFNLEDNKTITQIITEKLKSLQKSLNLSDFEIIRDEIDSEWFDVNNINWSKKYKYYSLIPDNISSIYEYCSDYQKIFIEKDSIINSNEIINNESFNFIEELLEAHKLLPGIVFFNDIRRLINFDSKLNCYTYSFLTEKNIKKFDCFKVNYIATKENDSISIIQTYLNFGYKVILNLNTAQRINSIIEALEKLNIHYEKLSAFEIPSKADVGICCFDLISGFDLKDEKVVFLSSKELFNEKVHVSRLDNRFKEGNILKSYDELEPGDYIVHEYHGIGQFICVENVSIKGIKNDYLKIAYAGGEFLYVQVDQIQYVRKYLGKEGVTPRLSKLHTSDWEKTKRRIKERINDLAERLMRLYTARSKIEGFQFPKDDEFQKQFEDNFQYELTKDQASALKDIKQDMESKTPMDRLLCGDVGFGKTEVAFRAAFKAINAGKQVALLCPTTLLARQHYEVAKERFKGFDINIALLSRLVNNAKQNEYIEGISEGKVHLAIGTHRLLSKNIHFKDLGLLIIDEEQRFGVEQKEKIKELKNNVDVLTLSATPIPRTLQISLLGVRAMSRIVTPPNDRMPIQTYVMPFRFEIVKELIYRELGRHGQAFYLYNNIDTLYIRANKLQQMMPDVHFGVIHGKMNRSEIEDVMDNFYKGNIDVLISTSIIENGIDIPNANMVIVEDSDHYGLAQLYQIKGRVGRSNRIAYAYLMYNVNKKLTDKANKRLKALQDFTELGAGYQIAQRDLLIRGAGDILGPEQAGFIDSIGLDMYIKLLNEAVKEKLTGSKIEKKPISNIDLNIEAYIPDNYANGGLKIEMYQEIVHSPSLEALAKLKLDIRDMFGSLPNEVEQLFLKKEVSLLKEEARINTFIDRGDKVEMTLSEDYLSIKGVGNLLFEIVIPFLRFMKISYVGKKFTIVMTKHDNWIEDLKKLFNSLIILINTHRTEIIE